MPIAPDGSEFVQVSAKELQELRAAARKLAALEAGGVDNWEWYDDVMSELYEDEDDNVQD